MNLRIGLCASAALAALLLLVAAALLWVNRQNEQLNKAYLNERGAGLRAALDIEKARLRLAVEALRRDTAFLAQTPPVSGIVRASANEGIDPRDRDPYSVWEARLQEIFDASLRMHPEYFQARFIGAAAEGRELVRVETRDGRTQAVPHEALQSKGDQDYFRAGLLLTAGRVQLSGFVLNREGGKIEEPYRPVVRAVTPIFDASGRVFGMVEIDEDVSALLAAAASGLPPGILAYVADQQGRYLFHPEPGRAFAFEAGAGGNIADDFPTLKPLFESRPENYLPLHAVHSGGGQYVAAERVFFDPADPSRYLVLAFQMPAAATDGQAPHISNAVVVSLLLLTFIVGALFALALSRIIAPLGRIVAGDRIMAEKRED